MLSCGELPVLWWCLISWFQSAHTDGRLLGASASGASSHPRFVPALITTGLCDEPGQLWSSWCKPLRKVGLSPFCGCEQNVQFWWGRLEMLPSVFVLVWIKPVVAQHPEARVTRVVPQLQTEIHIYNSVIWDVLFLEINSLPLFFFFFHSFSNSEQLGCRTLLQKMLHRLNSLASPNVTWCCSLRGSSLKNTTQLQELLKENKWEEIQYLVHWTS